MTGIERLYKLIADIDVNADPELWYILRDGTEGDWDCDENDDKTLCSTLAAIADQIEREQGGRVSRMHVLAVVTEMERHVSGVEGMEDSPVARWARALREAFGGDGRDPAADVSVSAYDLLPQEERDAIAWVREHGGLDAVERRWECLSYYADPVPRSCMERRLARRQRQIDESHAALRRRNQRIEELNHRACDLTRENAELRKRTMPEGCKWPRNESGDLVMFGDCVENRNGTCTVNSVRFYSGGGVTVYGEGRGAQFVVVTEPVMRDPIRKANPKVLAADGEPLEVGQTVWDTDAEADTPLTVVEVSSDLVRCEYTWKDGKTYRPGYPPDQLTHQRPVLDADGVPIREGDTVWNATTSARPLTVREIERSDDPDEPEDIVWCGEHAANGSKVWRIAGQLTHRAPVLAADGKPLLKYETVYEIKTGERYFVTNVFDGMTEPDFPEHTVECRKYDDVVTHMFEPSQLTHERPDSWERIEEDAGCTATKYNERRGTIFTTKQQVARDLVRRCRALAERERGE